MTIARATLLATVCLLWLSSTHAAVESEPLDAMWHQQQLNFFYRAERTFHSCASLARRVARILQALGARGGTLRLRCTSEMPQHMGLEITLATPVEATAENILEATTFGPTDRLIAQVRGEDLLTANDIERFPATWRRVSLTSAGGLGIGSGDCELIHGMKDQIFPKLAVRVPDGFRCNHDSAVIRPNVTVEALVPLANSN